MSSSKNPAAPHFLPSFITAPGETDPLLVGAVVFRRAPPPVVSADSNRPAMHQQRQLHIRARRFPMPQKHGT